MKVEMILKELVSININGQMAVNMKKVIIILSACLIVFMTACAGQGKDASVGSKSSPSAAKQTDSPISADLSETEQRLIKVMNNTENFSDESGSDTLFADYKLPWAAGKISIVAEKYAFVDLDGDGINELAVKCTNGGINIILHYNSEDNKIHGYSIGERSFIDVKTDGTFAGSGGAMISVINKMSFDNGNVVTAELALKDEMYKIYKIDGKDVTQSEAAEYLRKWDQIDSVKWSKELISN